MAIDTTQRVESTRRNISQRTRAGDPSGRAPQPRTSVCQLPSELRLARTVDRCGSDVLRLLGEPVPVISTIFGMGFQTVRSRNAATLAGLDSGALSLEAGDDALIVRGRHSILEIDREAWQTAFLRMGLDGQRSVAVAYDDGGEASLEIVLDPCDLEALAPALPQLEHPRQRPSPDLVPDREPRTWLETDIDEQRLNRHWKRRGRWEHIRALERGFRVDRRQLFETLPPEWAASMRPNALHDLANAIGGDMPCVVETFGNGVETTVRPASLHAPAPGRPLAAVGDDERVLLDPNGLREAFVVRKPCRDGLRTAIECFDRSGRLQARLRPTEQTDLHQRLTWRSSMPHGRLCSSRR